MLKEVIIQHYSLKQKYSDQLQDIRILRQRISYGTNLNCTLCLHKPQFLKCLNAHQVVSLSPPALLWIGLGQTGERKYFWAYYYISGAMEKPLSTKGGPNVGWTDLYFQLSIISNNLISLKTTFLEQFWDHSKNRRKGQWFPV